jgi:hypothetical protein
MKKIPSHTSTIEILSCMSKTFLKEKKIIHSLLISMKIKFSLLLFLFVDEKFVPLKIFFHSFMLF